MWWGKRGQGWEANQGQQQCPKGQGVQGKARQKAKGKGRTQTKVKAQMSTTKRQNNKQGKGVKRQRKNRRWHIQGRTYKCVGEPKPEIR